MYFCVLNSVILIQVDLNFKEALEFKALLHDPNKEFANLVVNMLSLLGIQVT